MAAEANKDTCGVREESGLGGVGHDQVGRDRDDVRLGARGEKYDDRAMLCCACHPSNLLSFAFSIYRREKRPRRRRRRRRQGACGKRYVDYTIIFASFPANLSSLLLVFAGKEEGQEQGRGGRRRKEEEEEEEEEVVVVVAAASDKGVQEKEATVEEGSAHNEVADKKYCFF